MRSKTQTTQVGTQEEPSNTRASKEHASRREHGPTQGSTPGMSDRSVTVSKSVYFGQAICLKSNIKRLNPHWSMGSDGELKSFGHAPIRLRGVIRRRDLSLLKIQFFRTTEDDFIARAAKTQ